MMFDPDKSFATRLFISKIHRDDLLRKLPAQGRRGQPQCALGQGVGHLGPLRHRRYPGRPGRLAQGVQQLDHLLPGRPVLEFELLRRRV